MTKQTVKLEVGNKVICHGYEGTVVKVHSGELCRMVDVRVPGGPVCVSVSEVLRETALEIYTERHFKGNAVRITGPAEDIHGGRFFPAVYLEGHRKGETVYITAGHSGSAQEENEMTTTTPVHEEDYPWDDIDGLPEEADSFESMDGDHESGLASVYGPND